MGIKIADAPLEEHIDNLKKHIQYLEEAYWNPEHRYYHCGRLTDTTEAKKQLHALELLQLTEEKRRLSAVVIEWLVMVSNKSFGHVLRRDQTALLFELHKRINSATTLAQLQRLEADLAKFKSEHPELDND